MKYKKQKKSAATRKQKRTGRFYVYIYTDPQTGKAFYVGKGTGERARGHGQTHIRVLRW